DPEIFDHIPAGEKFDFARNLFPKLMGEGHVLKAWLARGNWSDVGSPRSLREAERWKLQDIGFTNISGDLYIKGARIMGPAQIGSCVSVAANSRVIGPVSIGAGTIIEENVVIGPYTSIGEGCIIKNSAKIFSSSIYNRVVIGRDSTISGSIIDNDTFIGSGCNIEHDTVIGPHVVLKSGVVVHSGTRLWPEVIIPEGTVVKEHILNEDYDTRTEGS
ncbi:MAG: NDP-sugar synthase, partial [Methanomicrobiaceae archaeon]|nr:NDP-sugar synthase [Methanomicrobiaceae archaeon]